jgi:vesicle coat complex subunit
MEGLNDPTPYVRKTAVIGVIKLFKISPETIESTFIIKKLKMKSL